MRKTFCNSCDEEITGNVVARVGVEIVHQTTGREPREVDQEDFDRLDLCSTCLSKPIVLHDLLRPRSQVRYEEMAVASPSFEGGVDRPSHDWPHP